MNKTSCFVALVNQDALEIKADGTLTVVDGGIQSFASIDDLKDAVAHINPYATYEPDYWLLDGNYKFAPASAHVGYMSSVMSAVNTDLTPVPRIRMQFTVSHSIAGLKLYFSEFSDDWVDSITIRFRDFFGNTIHIDTYNPSAATFEINQAVSNFYFIDIILNSTNKPQRYARVAGIDFDNLTIFRGTDIREARLVEQIDPLSLELPINELDLTLFSADGDFSIVDPSGFYANLQDNEPLDVYENVNNEIIYIGRFYLEKWESLSENLATFHAADAIAFLDKFTFLGDLDLSNSTDSEDYIAAVFEDTNIDYELDSSFVGIDIKGLLRIASRREALQQLAVRLGAYVTCARSRTVRILPTVLAGDANPAIHTITGAQKSIDSPVQLRPFVTGVEVLEQIYTYDNAAGPDVGRVFFDDSVTTGEHIIFFDVLCQVKTITGTATISAISHPLYGSGLFTSNFLHFNCTGAGTLKVEYASGFVHTKRTHSVSHAGQVSNIIRIEDALLLVTPTVAEEVLDRVDAYFAQRYVQNTKLFASLVQVGDKVLVDTQSNKQIQGIVERMTTDLARGFVSDVEIVGVIAA